MFKCELCKYETDDRTAYYHHTKTKKHKLCSERISKDAFDEIKKENEELKKKLKEKDEEIKNKEIEKLQAINKIYEEQRANTINNTQNNTINIGTLNYINNKFPDAPPLEKITDFVINGIDIDDASQHDKFIDNIIYHHNHKTLHTLLGEHIISLYKKSDLSKQSFHTTDTARLNYAVRIVDNVDIYDEVGEEPLYLEDVKLEEINNDDNRYTEEEFELLKMEREYLNKLKDIKKQKELKRLLEENKKMWVTDKNGYKICKLLIDPTIKKMVNVLKNKIKRKVQIKKKPENIIKDIEYHKKISEIIENTDTKKLKNDINKYIAPVFNLSKKYI